VTGFCVRIVVQGRIGPAVRSALAGLNAKVTPRHSVIVGADGLPELLAALEFCNRRGIEVDRISSRAGYAADAAHSRALPDGGTTG
jgi:hypothetical protein